MTFLDTMEPAGGSDANMSFVVLVCMTMYGFLAAAWAVYRNLSQTYPHHDAIHVSLLCLSWSAASVGMSMLNKSLINELEAPSLVAICQMIITAFATLGYCWQQIRNAPSRQIRTWMVVPIFFAAVLCTSFYTLKYISLSVMTLVRNLAPLFILPIEKIVMPPEKQPHVSVNVLVSFLVMLCGAAIYCEGVQGISTLGVVFGVVNLLVAMVVRIIEKRLLTLECKDLTSGVCTYITNFAGIVPCLLLAMFTNDFESLRARFDLWTKPSVLFVLAMSGAVGLGIGYFGYETQRVITATSMVVLQNLAKVATVSFGMLFFGDPISVTAFIGISLSISGSMMYGLAQSRASAAEQAERQHMLKDKDRQAPTLRENKSEV